MKDKTLDKIAVVIVTSFLGFMLAGAFFGMGYMIYSAMQISPKFGLIVLGAFIVIILLSWAVQRINSDNFLVK